MTRAQYLAITGGGRTRDKRSALQSAFGAAHTGFSVVFHTETACVFADRAPPPDQVRQSALLLGDLFPRSVAHKPSTKFVPASWEIDDLLRDTWGDYILISVRNDGGGTQIFRSPFGRLPCYYCVADGIVAVASHVDLLLEAGLISGALDWTAVRTHLLAPDFRGTQTCLADVVELIGGGSLSVSNSGTVCAMHWTPWQFEISHSLVRDQMRAAAELEAIVNHAVSWTCAPYAHVMLGVSGGLDSSIVASAAARSAARLTLITISTDDRLGDERTVSRALADELHLGLVEEFERLPAIDLRRSSAAHLPRPLARSFAQSSDEILVGHADSLQVDAFMSGAGGDNIFWNLRSPSVVADRILVEGLGIGALQTAKDLSVLAKSDLWTALRRGVRLALRRAVPYEWPIDAAFLSAETLSVSLHKSLHPWLSTPKGTLPGKKQHVACIMAIENHLEGYGREIAWPMLAPLLTQPVVEKCFEIPSWFWCLGGEDRALARAAFNHRLPSAVIERRVKGSPLGLALQVFDANRRFLVEWLRDGVLVQQGILDMAAIERVLADPSPRGALSMLRILTIADVETWARARIEKMAASSGLV